MCCMLPPAVTAIYAAIRERQSLIYEENSLPFNQPAVAQEEGALFFPLAGGGQQSRIARDSAGLHRQRDEAGVALALDPHQHLLLAGLLRRGDQRRHRVGAA